MRTVHAFRDTGDAYDLTQCSDDIKTGDILFVPSKGVIGFAWAWPVAITIENGHLHAAREGVLRKVLLEDIGTEAEAIDHAIALAKLHGFPVNPELEAGE